VTSTTWATISRMPIISFLHEHPAAALGVRLDRARPSARDR
jgi:hypothetical protein